MRTRTPARAARIATALLAPMALMGSETPRAARPSATVRKLLGDRAITILQGASRVEVFQVAPGPQPGPEVGGRTDVGRYPITAIGGERDAKFAAKVTALLLDEKTYPRDTKSCEIRPGVAFRLWKGRESVDLLLCFVCDILVVIVRDERGEAVKKTSRDFDPARLAFVTLAREAFPDDPDIRALRNTRH